MNLYEEQRRQLIDCPNDVILYKCKVQSSSENLHLIWNITISGSKPVTIQYNSSFDKLTNTQVSMGITSLLYEYNSAEGYVESRLIINLGKTVSFDRMHLKCFVTNFPVHEKTVLLRESGMMCIYDGSSESSIVQ